MREKCYKNLNSVDFFVNFSRGWNRLEIRNRLG